MKSALDVDIIKIWEAKITQCDENIARIKAMPSINGQRWTDGMVRYWTARRSELLSAMPKRQAP
jgi:hypothetical protein